MGYYTHYTLEIKHINGATHVPQCEHAHIPDNAQFCPQCGVAIGQKAVKQIILDAINENEDLLYALGQQNSCKWYEHERDMRAFSMLFPGHLFTLCGKGEETPDLWKKYFKNGKMQVAKARIEYDEFDPARLK